MAEESPKMMMATKDTTGERLGVEKSCVGQRKVCQKFSTESQKLTFPKVAAKYHESIAKMFTSFPNI